MRGLSQRQRECLSVLSVREARTAEQLAEALGTSRHGAVRTASSLVARGYAFKGYTAGRVHYSRARAGTAVLAGKR